MDNHNPLISIIVPVYKVEKYLKRCVYSIVKQDYKNLEIILVDDGSPDNCPQICDEFAKKDKRIRVIHKENGGLSSARNAGLNICTGEYVSFVDSDDYVNRYFISSLYELIKKYDLDISVCLYKNIYTEKISKDLFSGRTKGHVTYSTGREYLKDMLVSNEMFYVLSCNKLYKSNLFDNISFPIGKLNEDNYTTYKLFLKADKVAITESMLYFYYQRKDSIMHGSSGLSETVIEATELFEKAFFSVFNNTDDKKYYYYFYLKKMNAYLDDYYREYVRHNKFGMSANTNGYLKERKKYLSDGYSLKFKFKLFDFSKILFILAMKIYCLKIYLENVIKE